MSFHRNQPLEVGLTPCTRHILSVYDKIKHNLEFPPREEWHDNKIQIINEEACWKRLEHFRSIKDAKANNKK